MTLHTSPYLHLPHQAHIRPLVKSNETSGGWVGDELFLCVFVGFLSVLLHIDNVCMETCGLHELILCVSEGFLSLLIWFHNVCMLACGLHELILCVSEELLLLLLCNHNVNIDDFCAPYLQLKRA